MKHTKLSNRSNKGYGWVPDIPDIRDYTYKAPVHQVQKLPPMVDLRDRCPNIYNQGELGSCTANAIAGALEFDLLKQGLSDFVPSRLFIYYNERAMEGTVESDSGAAIRDGVKSVNKQGVCDENDWVYDISKFTERPTDTVYQQALGNIALEYQRVPRDLNQMKSVIASGYPFVAGFTVYSYFETQEMANNGILNIPKPDETVLGGHAVLVCFTKDTKISLLNGEEKSFGELIDEGIYNFWVYSMDKNGNIVPGLAHSPRKTGEKRPILKITLDNNEQVKCTENHLFMLRDGSYKEAITLSIGESLMPLYRKKSTTKEMEGYDMFWNNQKWNLTHRSIYAHINDGEYNDEVVHHVDFNKLNNNPDNLVGMTWKDHTNLHNEQTRLLEIYSRSDKGRLKSKQLMDNLWSNEQWNKNMKDQLSLKGEIGRLKQSIGKCERRYGMKQYILNEIQKRNKIIYNAVNNLKQYNIKVKQGVVAPTEKQIESRRLNAQRINEKRWNHKVVNIEKLGQEDVYDITVEKYHNFALSAGVFVHNCGYDDSKKSFIVRNSWGKDWGLDGYFYMNYNYLLNENLGDDYWRITKIK